MGGKLTGKLVGAQVQEVDSIQEASSQVSS